ncbi:MAG: bifunctional diaminohydroxyphosphoribosylaminopyrimidine deaminase/5-amino-6-(5-phosphoribosylamino)uracil reductase RibD [Bryobacterales bacterium]|nr:bifunctional diaminohydroxyphosphoribosylaminopyrimidine deaminase/5-amino-6-(5-phosphoribosylamino)uracil reductase RibD [Acidobacteriota bacterium]MCB9384152.1 bifunctional diaminohydroxyphosphoribosylaminopyrimidine deaminase/5-amino-6-(5-phosphoribosylamino)uracil reductase RibD [Bryobacterales bacterium]
MITEVDRGWMREALELAGRGSALASPNPVVGAVVVDAAGDKAGEGFHRYAEVAHAEALALEQAGERAQGGTLYVTLEPCSHQGRTAPCVDAVIAAGVKRVVCPIEDESPKVSGAGFRRLREAGVEVDIMDELAGFARRLNEDFFHYAKTGLPLVTLKTAATLDGKISAPDDNSGWITSEVARRHVQTVRHRHDAILTGIGTVLEDDPLMTDRLGLPRRRPLLRIVVDSLCRISLESQLVMTAEGDVVIATTSAAPAARREALEQHGVKVWVCDSPKGRVDLKSVIEAVGQREMTSLMIEAGSKLNWAALDEGLVDKALIYYAPKILGGMESLPLAGGIGRRSRSGAIRLHDLSLEMVGPDEFCVEAYL